MSNPPPISRKPKNYVVYRAMEDFEPEEADLNGYTVLKFEEGDLIKVVESLDENWINAIINGKKGIVLKEFVDERASQIFPLHEACRRSNLGQVQIELKNGALVNQKDKTNATAVWWAASAGSEECVQALLQNKHTKSDIANNMGETPLHVAAVKGHAEIVQMLLNHNDSTLMMKNKMGKTALDLSFDPAVIGLLKSLYGIVAVQDDLLVESDMEEDSDDE